MPRHLLCFVALLGAGCPTTAGPDAGAQDAGAQDAGAQDAGAQDAGAQDAGAQDAGGVDAGPVQCPAVDDAVALGSLGADEDTVASAVRRVVLMGGSVEVDPASTEFVDGAAGGDVLVLRASGSVNSYTPYFYEELPTDVAPASVTTLRIEDAAPSADPGVLCRVQAAEALWLAGGDQYAYLGIWRSALHDEIAALATRGAAIGGTSAGAMALGAFAFDAAQGSVSSAEALADPFDPLVSVVVSPLAQPELLATVVDTHFSARDREGRLLTFMARAKDAAPGLDEVWGVGLDERAALVIEDGQFVVHTGAPDRRVWLYRYTGTPTLNAGVSLELEGVQRLAFAAGATGFWPVGEAAWADAVSLTVVGGVVSEVAP